MSSVAPAEKDALTIEVKNVLRLAQTISQIDLTGVGQPDVPWGNEPTLAAFAQAIESGIHGIPLPYQNAYVAPLRENLERLLFITNMQGGDDPGETLLGAIYDHAAGSEVAAPLRRFLGVISDLYDSFLNKEQRAGLNLPLLERLPPLATFRHDGALGPYTFPADVVRTMINADVGVVSIPAVYSAYPAIWASLAHETGGHDVLHADASLLPELKAGVSNLFNGLAPYWGQSAEVAQFLGQLWSYWMDEAASDVYGVLNIGPAFALNFAPWLAALRERFGQTQLPNLLTMTVSGPSSVLDTHPVDILRLHLVIGATANLHQLNPARRQAYVNTLQQLAEQMAGEADSILIEGNLPVANNATIAVSTSLPLPLMQYAAALVGGYVATAPFACFQFRSVQEIETWDELDEAVAQKIAAGFSDGGEVGLLGDAAHLLAGATLALTEAPESFAEINEQLARALSLALSRDPIWAAPQKLLTHIPPAAQFARAAKEKTSAPEQP